nr:putative ribonuclease H-like domain-containing protein [Tanacetum cinerariifolium]
MLEGLDPKMLGSSLKLTEFSTLVLLRYTITSGLDVIMSVWLASLGGTMGLEVILVKGQFVPLIVKVLLVDCDPLVVVEVITHVEDNKGLLVVYWIGNVACVFVVFDDSLGLESSRTSSLVNGSPTSEFCVKRDLRRGDSLLPYLEFKALMHEKFQMSAMGELNFFLGLQVLQKEDGIFLSQDKYIGDILKKFRFSDFRSSNTPMDKENPWGKDGPGKDVELHLYRFMIGSLMYLTASRPDIMFAVYACARHQVTPKESYSYCDYGASQDRKSTTGGSQFLGRRLISWQCKKQTIVATSTTEAEYVAAASCCGQVLWIQNQLLDYG